jgi:hypothetical protein
LRNIEKGLVQALFVFSEFELKGWQRVRDRLPDSGEALSGLMRSRASSLLQWDANLSAGVSLLAITQSPTPDMSRQTHVQTPVSLNATGDLGAC